MTEPFRENRGPVIRAALGAAYLAAEGFEAQLETELARRGVEIVTRHGRLYITDRQHQQPIAWAANTWYNPVEIPIRSIGHGAGELRSIQRNWWPYAPAARGRTKLIDERMPHVSARPLQWDEPAPTSPLGSWTLLTPDLLIASARCSSPFPNGEVRLVEDLRQPPSRAYLKLWEALVRAGDRPGPNDTCLDLGASPGGWTWLLARTGARVIAIDKAPLDPRVAALPNVEWHRESAFALDPDAYSSVTWMCCDVVGYPRRLLALVRRWLARESPPKIVCTIKFQGETDHDVVDELAAIPGAEIVHLHHNKHELTFLHLGR